VPDRHPASDVFDILGLGMHLPGNGSPKCFCSRDKGGQYGIGCTTAVPDRWDQNLKMLIVLPWPNEDPVQHRRLVVLPIDLGTGWPLRPLLMWTMCDMPLYIAKDMNIPDILVHNNFSVRRRCLTSQKWVRSRGNTCCGVHLPLCAVDTAETELQIT